jgi:hypothetical protein
MNITGRKILSVLAAAVIGFALGLGLLFQFSPHAVWFAANAPGLFLSHPLAPPGSSVWMIPLGNGLAYAAIALLFIVTISFTRGRRTQTSI